MGQQGKHSAGRSRTQFVGRTEELRHLEGRWSGARDGKGGAVVVIGEPGIGKSRLALELEQRIHADAALILKFYGSAQHSNSDLHPLFDNLFLAADVRRTDPDQVRRAKIEKLWAATSASQPPLKLLQGLVALGGGPPAQHELQSPQQRRDTIFEALLDGLAEVADTRPILLIVDDAQWLDPTSRELLARMVERSAELRLLIVVAAQREFEPDWISAPQTSFIIPRRLNPADAKALAERVPGADRLAPAELQDIVDRSEGVPLFLEELARELTTAGASSDQRPTGSTDLQALLTARIDRLGVAKRMAQFVAAIGRRFGHDIAASVWDGGESEFQQLIERLMAAEVLLAMPIARGVFYTFRHALLQQAANASVPAQQRIAIHTRIVRALEARPLAASADQPEIMAYHCDHAEMHLKAAACWLDAGKASAARGSVVEAVNYFKLGIASAGRAAAGKSREQLLFDLNMNLGPALMALNGYASDVGLAAFLEARQRLHLSRSSMEQIHVLLGLFNVHFGRGEFVQALDVAQQADSALAVGYGGYPVLLGQTLCMMGRFPEARRCLERALAGYNPTIDQHSGLFCQADVVAASFLAKTEFALGHLDRSAELTRIAMDLARRQGHPIALAIAYLGQLFFATEAGELELARTTAEEALAHATEHDLGNYQLWVSFHRAALGMRTDAGSAVVAMEQILDQAQAAGTRMFRPVQLGLLGAAYGRLGRHREALSRIDQGMETARETSCLETLPALHRLRATVLVELERPVEAVRDVEASMSIARAQSARTEELRAAIMFARMVKGTERRDHALDRLSKLYATFEQGLQFPDLKHAARLLASSGRCA